MVVRLPRAIAVELAAGDLIQINKGHSLLFSHLFLPLGMRFAYNLAMIIIGIAWCQRHQNRMSSLRPYIINILTHISAIGVNSLVFTSFLNRHLKRIITYTRNTGSGTTRIVRAIIIMSDTDNHPVARTDRLLDRLPKLFIKGATAHAAKRLVLNGNFRRIEILMGIEAPTPLAIIAIPQRTCTHGRVAYQE